MSILHSLRSEIVKTKRTAAFYFALIGAAVIPVVFLFNVLTDGLPDENKSNKDPLNAMFKLSAEITGLAIFPWFVILVCTLLPQIEHRSNTWKQVLASPQTKVNIFSAKFLNIQLLVLVFLLASHVFMWLVAIVAHFALPKLDVLNQPFDAHAVVLTNANTYVALLAVCALQHWMGLRYKNFIVPIAVGLVLWLMGTVLALEYHSSLANYFPYSFQTFNFSPVYRPGLQQMVWKSLGYAVFVLAMAFLDFRRRRLIG